MGYILLPESQNNCMKICVYRKPCFISWRTSWEVWNLAGTTLCVMLTIRFPPQHFFFLSDMRRELYILILRNNSSVHSVAVTRSWDTRILTASSSSSSSTRQGCAGLWGLGSMGLYVCADLHTLICSYILFTTRGSFYSMVWLINLKVNNNQYYVDKPFQGCSKRQYYWMKNKEQYVRRLPCSHRSQIGLLVNPQDVHYPGPSLWKAASRLNL